MDLWGCTVEQTNTPPGTRLSGPRPGYGHPEYTLRLPLGYLVANR